MVQVPAVTPLTVEPFVPLTVHMPVVVLLKVTGLPDAPPVAVSAPLLPTAIVGATPKFMVWGATGVTLLDGLEGTLGPAALVAATVKV